MVKPCRVIHIITTLELGGAQQHALFVAAELDPRTFETMLISGSEGLLPPDARRLLGDRWVCMPALRRSLQPWRDMIAWLRLVSLLRNLKPHIVHTHSSKAGILGRWAARVAGVPVIIHTIHGWSFTPAMPRVMRRLIIALERAAAGVTTRLVAVSQHDIDQGLRCRIGRPEQYRLVRLGVAPHPETTGRAASRREQCGPVDVLSIACLKPQKNPRDIVRAAALVAQRRPGVRWALAGDGVLRPQVEALIREQRLEKAVTVLGWRRDIPELLRATKVVVLTSLWEGMPLALLEAMAAGLPVVAYNVGGIGEIVQDGVSGCLVAPGEVRQLSECVIALLSDPGLAQRRGEAGKQFLRERGYSARTMLASLEEVYEQGWDAALITGGSRCRPNTQGKRSGLRPLPGKRQRQA